MSCWCTAPLVSWRPTSCNAIQHSAGEWTSLTLELCNGILRIRVHDGVATSRPTNLRKPGDDENGRGLTLVRDISRNKQGARGVSDCGATYMA